MDGAAVVPEHVLGDHEHLLLDGGSPEDLLGHGAPQGALALVGDVSGLHDPQGGAHEPGSGLEAPAEVGHAAAHAQVGVVRAGVGDHAAVPKAVAVRRLRVQVLPEAVTLVMI